MTNMTTKTNFSLVLSSLKSNKVIHGTLTIHGQVGIKLIYNIVKKNKNIDLTQIPGSDSWKIDQRTVQLRRRNIGEEHH